MTNEEAGNLIIGGATIILILLGIFVLPFIKFSSRGSGNHSGYVTAIDKVGYIFPNYEVYFKTNPQTSQEDKYCVSRNNDYLVSQLRQSSKNNQRVTISYHGVRGVGVGLCDGEEIDSVQIEGN